MNTVMYALAFALSVGASVFFLVRAMQARAEFNSMSTVERRYAEINEHRVEQEKVSFTQRVQGEATRLGLGENTSPLVVLFAFVALVVMALLYIVGVPQLLAVAAALPGAFGAAWGYLAWSSRRRRAQFNRQLIDLLDLITGQIKAGTGAERALLVVAHQMPEPMRSEMISTLSAGQSSKDTLGALRQLSERYPSRAFTMFLSALEINQAEGQAIGPALEQAADLLKKQFALASEAKAELSQTKNEFIFVLGVVIAIMVYLVLGGGGGPSEEGNIYFTFGGIIVLLGAIANTGFGVFRFFRVLNKIQGDT